MRIKFLKPPRGLGYGFENRRAGFAESSHRLNGLTCPRISAIRTADDNANYTVDGLDLIDHSQAFFGAALMTSAGKHSENL